MTSRCVSALNVHNETRNTGVPQKSPSFGKQVTKIHDHKQRRGYVIVQNFDL